MKCLDLRRPCGDLGVPERRLRRDGAEVRRVLLTADEIICDVVGRGCEMTTKDCELIAKVLRNRISEIGKLFEPRDVRVPDIEYAMKIQIVVLAHDLGLALAKQDPTFDDILVNAAQEELAK